MAAVLARKRGAKAGAGAVGEKWLKVVRNAVEIRGSVAQRAMMIATTALTARLTQVGLIQIDPFKW